MTTENCPKIVVFDDDHWPDGRITGEGRVLEEFQKRGLGSMVIHISTWKELRSRVDSLRDSLFVLDSSIVNEGEAAVSFETTVPFLISSEVKAKRIMPASGGREGRTNNEWFEEYCDRRGYGLGINQMSLSYDGLSGDPKEIVDNVLCYYKEVFGGVPEGCEHVAELARDAGRYWREKGSTL